MDKEPAQTGKPDRDFLLKDQEMREETIKEAKRAAREAFDEAIGRVDKPIEGHKAIAAEELIGIPLSQKETEWRQNMETMVQQGADIDQLVERRNELAKQILEYPQVVKRFAIEIASEGGTSNEIVRKLLQSKANVYEMSKRFIEKNQYPEVYEALKTVLNVGMDDKDIDEAQKEAMKVCADHIKRNTEMKSMAWLIIRLADNESKIKFAKEYAGEMDQPGVINFLEEGNSFGAFSPDIMREVAPNAVQGDKEKLYAANFQIEHNLEDQTKRVLKGRYSNAANEKINLKNIGFLALEFAAFGTIIGNIVANIYKDGKLQSPKEWLSAVNGYSLGAGAAIAAVEKAKKGESIIALFESKQEKQSREEKTAVIALKNIQQVPDWREFTTGDNFSGGEALWAYRTFLRTVSGKFDNLPSHKLKSGEFLTWLKANNKEKQYDGVIEKLEAIRAVNVAKADREFSQLLGAFDVLKIGGATLQDSYNKYINQTETT